MDKGKGKAVEAAYSPPRPTQRVGRPRRYPLLQDQERCLWEIPVPVPRDGSPAKVKLYLNANPPILESCGVNEAGGSSGWARAGKEPETCDPREDNFIVAQTGESSMRPASGIGPGTGGLKSKVPYIGQVVSGSITGEFSGGYLLKLSIGNSTVTYPGVLFLPGSFNPFDEEHGGVPSLSPILNNAAAAVDPNSWLIRGAIQWGKLNVGGPLVAKDRASKEALKKAAAQLLKLPENVPDDLLWEVIERVCTKSRLEEPLVVATGRPNPMAIASLCELRVTECCLAACIFFSIPQVID